MKKSLQLTRKFVWRYYLQGRTILCFFILFTLHSSFFTLSAQTWLWGAQGSALKANDMGAPVATDKYGNAFTTGSYYTNVTFGTNNMVTPFIDAYVVKYNSSGILQWATCPKSPVSATAASYGTSIVTDTLANVFVTGWFDDSLTFSSFVLKGVGTNSFITKYDGNGNVLWASQSTTGSDQSWGVATDKSGNAFITGEFTGITVFGTDTLKKSNTNQDAFLVKYDPTGSVLWANQSVSSSTPAYARGNSVATDNWGNSFITGVFMDSISFGSLHTRNCKNYNAFVTKYDAAGNPVWVEEPNLYSSFCTATGSSVATDNSGNIYVAGTFKDTVNFGSFRLMSTPATSSVDEAFLVKYSPSGNVIWAEQTVDSGVSYSPQLSADAYNHIYFTYAATGIHPQLGSQSLSVGPDYAEYIIKLDTAGHVLCNSSINENDVMGKNGIASDTTGTYIYTAGTLYGTLTFGTTVLVSAGANPFVARWQGCCAQTAPKADTTICSGNTITLTASGGTSYSWNTGATTSSINVKPADSTAYTVTINRGGCIIDSSVIVRVKPMPIPFINCAKTILCLGDSTTITASGGGTYSWSNGATTSAITVKPGSNTTYKVTVSNGFCTSDTSMPIIVYPVPKDSINPVAEVCAGSQVELTALGGAVSYSWSNDATTSSITVNPLVTTSYSVTVSNGPCLSTDSIKVIVSPGAAGTACCTDTIPAGTNTGIGVTPVITGETYEWTPSATLSCNNCPDPLASPTVTTVYYVTITDSNGCSIKDSVEVYIREKCGTVFVPDAFSPNHDGQNDVLYVRGNCIKAIDFNIYDRWGNKVFETKDINIGWDGMYGHEPMNTGVFSYDLQVLLEDGKTYSQKGSVSLVR